MTLLISRVADRKDKPPLEEVQNVLARVSKLSNHRGLPPPTLRPRAIASIPETPINRTTAKLPQDYMPSAMKGIILTSTGEPLTTPTPAEVAKLFVNSPKVGLNFSRIFEFDEDEDEDTDNHPVSPTERVRPKAENVEGSLSGTNPVTPVPQSRLRRPSMQHQHPAPTKTSTMPSASATSTSAPRSDHAGATSSSLPARTTVQAQSSTTAPSKPTVPLPPPSARPVAEYDLSDEENLPSPFIKRIDKGGTLSSGMNGTKRTAKRPSGGNWLRAVAAANVAGEAGKKRISMSTGQGTSAGGGARPLLVSAMKASEEARKALSRS